MSDNSAPRWTASDTEEMLQFMTANPSKLNDFRRMVAAELALRAAEMPWEQRLQIARDWVWEIGSDREIPEDFDPREFVPKVDKPPLMVRCAEPGRHGKPCGVLMARFWSTPAGHYGEVRKAPGHEQNMRDLNLALRIREEGDPAGAAWLEDGVGKPVILPVLLEYSEAAGGQVPLGCARDHGNMLYDAAALITECDSSRRKLNVYPVRWRADNVD